MTIKSINDKISLKVIIVITILITAGVTIQALLASIGNQYTHYNNFVLFKNSFGHLIQNKNLYIYYPDEYFDLYKYSPTFSLFMGVFYYLPDYIGLSLFNVLNVSLFLVAILKLKFPSKTGRNIFLFLLLEFAISLHWTQTNSLIASLIILSFICFEEEKLLWASLFIALTVFIKVFGIVACALAILYPKKARFVIYFIIWCLVLAALPVIIIPKEQLAQHYNNWFNLLKVDHQASYGVSFLGWIHSWFKIALPKLLVVAVAVVIFCIPLLKFKYYKLYFFRLQILASILLWIVIFNHKGESPTYIIAMEGVASWYFSQKRDKLNTILMWLSLIFTSFTSTDLITPGWINDKYIEPYSVKAVFCSFIWFKLIIDLITERSIARAEEFENKDQSIIMAGKERIV